MKYLLIIVLLLSSFCSIAQRNHNYIDSDYKDTIVMTTYYPWLQLEKNFKVVCNDYSHRYAIKIGKFLLSGRIFKNPYDPHWDLIYNLNDPNDHDEMIFETEKGAQRVIQLIYSKMDSLRIRDSIETISHIYHICN